METHRFIDRQIAEKVMGWKPHNKDTRLTWKDNKGEERLLTGTSLTNSEWSPSTCLNDAWEVIEYLKEKGVAFSLFNDDETPGLYYASFMTNKIEAFGRAEEITASMAICLAAIRMMDLLELDGGHEVKISCK